MEMVNIKINNIPLSVPKGISILEAARTVGIEIPTLCYLKKINEILGAEITGNRVIPGLTIALALRRLEDTAK